MKSVNLLPDWYVSEQRQRRSLRTQLTAIGVVTLLAAGCVGVLRWQTGHMDQKAAQLARQAQAGHGVVVELARNQDKLRRMQAQQVAFRDVGVPVPMSRVTQQILNNLTPGTALCGVSIDVETQTARGKGLLAKGRATDVAHLTIDGIAPNAVRIAQLIGKLSANPLFSEITLNYSRSELLRDYSVKRFEILMQLDLNDLAIPDTAPDAGVAARDLNAGGEHAG